MNDQPTAASMCDGPQRLDIPGLSSPAYAVDFPPDFDVTDCPICPQLATDRDDALREVAALTDELERLRRWQTEACTVMVYLDAYNQDGCQCTARRLLETADTQLS